MKAKSRYGKGGAKNGGNDGGNGGAARSKNPRFMSAKNTAKAGLLWKKLYPAGQGGGVKSGGGAQIGGG